MKIQPPIQRQYHSYGIRFWKNEKWMYLGHKYNKNIGWTEVWIDKDYHCYSTTSLLSAMFTAQNYAIKQPEDCIEVVEFNEPKTVWVTHNKNRLLELEEIEKQKERLNESLS